MLYHVQYCINVHIHIRIIPTDRTLEVAYTDTVGARSESETETTAASIRKALSLSSPTPQTRTPGSQLLDKYEKSLKTKSKSSELNTGENLFTTELRKTFNSVKDTLYDTGKKKRSRDHWMAGVEIIMQAI